MKSDGETHLAAVNGYPVSRNPGLRLYSAPFSVLSLGSACVKPEDLEVAVGAS